MKEIPRERRARSISSPASSADLRPARSRRSGPDNPDMTRSSSEISSAPNRPAIITIVPSLSWLVAIRRVIGRRWRKESATTANFDARSGLRHSGTGLSHARARDGSRCLAGTHGISWARLRCARASRTCASGGRHIHHSRIADETDPKRGSEASVEAQAGDDRCIDILQLPGRIDIQRVLCEASVLRDVVVAAGDDTLGELREVDVEHDTLLAELVAKAEPASREPRPVPEAPAPRRRDLNGLRARNARRSDQGEAQGEHRDDQRPATTGISI